ncbi:YkvA family protein [uncultured Hoeflea sp.]|uniref:YkvA family protein n=1 Tax=uncultured Hoeflea sp. TaxID=538666 RepID=UPI0030ED811E
MTGLDGEILEPENLSSDKTAGADEKSVRAGFWRTFGKAAKQIPLAEDVVAAYYCALDPKTPAKAKAVLMGALAYFILPTDAVPDFLALVGFSDDIAVLTLAIATVRTNMTEAHRIAARNSIANLDGDKAKA